MSGILESVTNAVKDLTVGDKKEDKVETAQNDAVLTSAQEGRRLYIGNLAYATTEGELKEFFKDYLVESTSIPTNPRTTRPVGYAFVDVSTSSEADRAIQELNGKTILDRKVSVQLARKPEQAGETAVPAGEGKEGEARRRPSQRGRSGRGRGRGGRATSGREANGTSEAPADSQVLPLTDVTNEAATGEKAANGEKKVAKEKKVAEPRKRGPPEDGIPSKTKVMVANLPYDLDEAGLTEIFAEYKPTTVKIALRPIPKYMIRKLEARNERRKGRGFGFVTLPSEEVQQKVCTEMNGKEVSGRPIVVKVAVDSAGKDEEAALLESEPEAVAA